ncbi:hypothetical protein Agub_g3586, partial [Astrephomene gubernaculifera]
ADVAQNLMEQLGGGGSSFVLGPSVSAGASRHGRTSPREATAAAAPASCSQISMLPAVPQTAASRRGVCSRSPLSGLLRSTPSTKTSPNPSLHPFGHNQQQPSGQQQEQQEQEDQQRVCSNLSSALALILTPQPPGWTELHVSSDGAVPDGTSDATANGGRDSKHAGAVPVGPGGMPGPLTPPGLLEKAATLLLHKDKSRRRSSIDFPGLQALESIRRGAGGGGVSVGGGAALESPFGRGLTNVISTRRRSLAEHAFSSLTHEPIDGATAPGDLRTTGRRSCGICTASTALSEANNAVAMVSKEDGACGAGFSGGMIDTEGGAGCSGGGVAGHSAERLVPRRLSAVMSLFARRGSTASLGSLPRDTSLDGGGKLGWLGGGGGGGNNGFIDGSFSATRNASLPCNAAHPLTPWGHAASEASLLAPPHNSRLGQLLGSPSRAASGKCAVSVADATAVAVAAPAPNGSAAVTPARRHLPPPIAVIDEVERLLAKADSWQFDSWALQEATQGHALSALGFYLIQRAKLLSTFRLKPVTLARLLRQIEAGYQSSNPYHNATHAADVLQTLHVIVYSAQLHVHYLDPLGLLAAYYAAIVHDYGHPGLTSDFLIATSDSLAVRYNDRSPLENHHCAASFSLLLRPELDLLAPLSPAERSSFRKQVIEMVLATDMKQHFSILSHFSTVHRLAAYSQQQQQQQQQAASPGGGPASSKQPKQLARRTLRRTLSRVLSFTPDSTLVSEPCAAFAANWSEPPPKPVDETERLLSLQVALKCADIGHLGEALEVHKRWLVELEEEFFRQGDRERQLGLPISSLFDRAKQGVSKSQVGFYEFVALPLVHALSSAFPGAQPLMRCFVQNYNHWRVLDGQQPVEVPKGKEQAADDESRRESQEQRRPSQRRSRQQERESEQQEPEKVVEPLGSMLLCVPDAAILTAADLQQTNDNV